MFADRLTRGLSKGRLQLALGVFFLALAIPTLILINQAFGQLELETFRQHQLMAEESVILIDQSLSESIRIEDARSFADYSFLVIEGDPAANFVQRSPLSAFPVDGAAPGTLGYFQVSADGELSTPLLPPPDIDPSSYGVSEQEQAQRAALLQTLRNVLAENRLLRGRALASTESALNRARVARADSPQPFEIAAEDAPQDLLQRAASGAARSASAEIDGQAAFDRLDAEPSSDADEILVTAARRAAVATELSAAAESRDIASTAGNTVAGGREQRSEQVALPQFAEAKVLEEVVPSAQLVRVSTFQSELDPFEFSLLDTGHFVLFRDVWRDGQRFVQGALIEQQAFLKEAAGNIFGGLAVAGSSSLQIRYQDRLLQTFSRNTVAAAALPGPILYQARLSPPFANLELVFSGDQLPAGPGYPLLVWVTIVLLSVLLGGCIAMYRFGLRQILLTRQQQDFVSAVSHELKTPLTSIRMYGEMLKAGWADDDKKLNYYNYIYEESERLSRLIDNVLQLARMTRGDPQLELIEVPVDELLEIVEPKIRKQVEAADFELRILSDTASNKAVLKIDMDSVMQIMINLVDNAIKFSAEAEQRRVEICCRVQNDATVLFSVRDFGPGVPRSKMKKLFELFYRPQDELTRRTSGTGIGLALVQQLASAMSASVDVRNRDPGAEFRVIFPLQKAATAST